MNSVIIANLLFIALISTFIIDISGVVDSFKSGLSYIMTKGKIKSSDYRLKPFDCSLCITFWTSILYLYLIDELSLLYLATVCIICSLIEVIRQSLLLVGEILMTVIKAILKLLRKV